MENRIKLILDSLKGDNVLDLGFIGNYPFELELHNLLGSKFKNVFGIDLRYAKVKNSIMGNILDLPVKSNSVDSIFAGEIIEHVIETEKFLDECRRVLKLNGRLVLTTPNKESYLNKLFKISFCEDHRKLFNKNEMEKALKKAGFRYKIKTFPYDEYSLVPHSKSNSKIFFVLRRIFHRILPENLHEGIFAVCTKS